jgi:hypothetical protein
MTASYLRMCGVYIVRLCACGSVAPLSRDTQRNDSKILSETLLPADTSASVYAKAAFSAAEWHSATWRGGELRNLAIARGSGFKTFADIGRLFHIEFICVVLNRKALGAIFRPTRRTS